MVSEMIVPTCLPAVPEHFNFAVDVVDRWAERDSGLLAMQWVDGHGSSPLDLTYTHYSERSLQAAKLSRDLGARPGDRMIIVLGRVPAW
jgi:medium-chain acyl-CoA synthetase